MSAHSVASTGKNGSDSSNHVQDESHIIDPLATPTYEAPAPIESSGAQAFVQSKDAAPDYFTSDLVTEERDDKRLAEDNAESRQTSLPPFVRPASSEASMADSHIAVPGTIALPSNSTHLRPLSDRGPHADLSIDSDMSKERSNSGSTIRQSDKRTSPRPDYPNQAYAALHHQHYPVRNTAPPLRTRSSHSNHALSLSGSAPFEHPQSGSKTVGNSPAVTPSVGLYSPRSAPVRDEWESPETPGTYASPYLHPTHRQAPKETHVADVDVDPISGRKLINHYEIIDELGRGTHGKVKLGRDLGTADSHVAIKIVERYSKRRRLGKLGNPEDKVKKEVAILKKARHPNIVALLEVIDDPTRKKVYIVLEWVERGTIHWRAKAPREIALLEAHRYEREQSGKNSPELQAMDKALLSVVEARLKRRRQERNLLYRNARKDRDPNRSIDHFGGNDHESDDDALSRVSTRTAASSKEIKEVRNDSAASTLEVAEDTINEGLITPTAISHEINHADLVSSLREQHTDAESRPGSGYASPFEHTDSTRAWTADLLDSELNPELEYVPCMTMQNIRVAFRDTLLGLQYLHYQGIVHRDIKPPNLLQTIDHRVKISDFGVSYLGRPVHDGEPGEGISESEAKDLDEEAKELAKTVGTPAFYAPELCITDHLDDHPPVTKAIDVWALGITLFCMLFARTPFVDTEFVVMRQIADEDIFIPRRRLRPVDDQPKSRSTSRSRTYSPVKSERRSEYTLEYEEIDDDLHDLLKRLLTKDPRQRILLETVRHHPWVVADLPNKVKWLEETDTNQQSQGKKIEVSKEDLNTAVVPLQFLERMRSGIKKIGDRLLGSTARGRSTSSATTSGSAPNSHPPSAHSSSSTISQDARRQSLRGDEIFSALRASRDADHHAFRNVATSSEHEKSNHAFFEDMPPTPGPAMEFGAALTHAVSHDSATRPSLPSRSRTAVSATTSIRTVKQSDFANGTSSSPPLSPVLPSTPRAIEGHAAANLSGLLGGSGRNVFKTIRERSSTRSSGSRSRAQSTDRMSIGSADAYAEPSVAVSETLVAGRVQAPELRPVKTPASSASNSVQHSPVTTRPQSMMLPPGYRSAFSRQSSASSINSSSGRMQNQEATPSRPSMRTSTTVSTAEEWRRAEEESTRRKLKEMQVPQKTTTVFDDRDCPPSPDDQRGRRYSGSRRISEFDIEQVSSHETSPITRSMPSSSIVSSSSDFGSAVSASISNPSIPSVISEASSLDAADGSSLEDLAAEQSVDIHKRGRNFLRDESMDDGYNPDADTALDSDNEDSDADTDSDGGLTMSRRTLNTKLLLGTSPRLGSLSAAMEGSHHKERRGTSVSNRSKKSSRSGSNNTMKKIRTRDSIDEQRPSAD